MKLDPQARRNFLMTAGTLGCGALLMSNSSAAFGIYDLAQFTPSET